jgi:uncharacterized protein (DUF1810 family)
LDLTRFLNAQTPVIDAAMAELAAGRKRTHWMWFVFPQLTALGRSATARYYGIGSLAEAKSYLADPVLSERLKACTRLVLAHAECSAHDIFGSPDNLKFRSCMTLFSLADPAEGLFRQSLLQFFGGEPDRETTRLAGGST